MIKHYTEKDLKEELKNLKIIADTRENANGHLTSFFAKNDLAVISRKLDVGDYSAQIGDMSFEKDFAIERKNSIDELAGNLGVDRDRFEREFIRAKAQKTKVFLVVENASWKDIFIHNYVSKLSEKALFMSLLSWQVKYNVTIIFCEKNDSARLISNIIIQSVKSILLGEFLK